MTLKYFNVKNGLTTGNITLNSSNSNISASTFIGNLSVTATANLGNVGNVIITGGSANYVLSTDGAGNLNWVAQTGGGGNSNLEALSDTFTGNGVQTTFTLSTTPANINLVTVNYNGEILLRNSFSLSGANLVFTEAPANNSSIEVTILSGNGFSGGGGTPGGSNTQVQFNDAGGFGGNAGFTFNKTNTTLTANNFVVTSTANLGNVGNITITGGSSGQYLQTNGSGGLSWATISTGAISNGNSNVSIPSANGNINLSAVGNANILVITGTGANIAGTLSVSGNANVGNIGTTTAIITTGNITTINSGLLQNGNSNITITANGNISISAAGTPDEIVVTSIGVNVAGTLSVAGNANVGNIGATGGIYTGNLSVTGGINDTGANFYTIGYREVPQVAKSANYTLENYDNGKHIYYTGTGSTLTLPADGSTTGGNFPVGTVLTVVNNSSGNVNINTSVTLNHAGTANTGNRILATKGLATIMKVASNTWFISGVGIT